MHAPRWEIVEIRVITGMYGGADGDRMRRHARDAVQICQPPGTCVKYLLVTPKVREAEELLGLKRDQS